MTTPLRYDYSYTMADIVGSTGVRMTDLAKLAPRLKAAHAQFSKDADKASMAYEHLLDDTASQRQVRAVAKQLQGQFDTLIVVGIGGSDLGSRALLGALVSAHHNELPAPQRKGMKIYFAGDTTDPTPLEELLAVVDLKKTAIHVISKSGNTIETISAFVYIRQQLIARVGEKNHSKHIVVTTSPDSGKLIELVRQENYTLLPHGPVGGRFAALSNVGLLACACAGINITQLLKGAHDMRTRTKTTAWKKNPAFIFAALHYLAATRNKQNIAVLMPYSHKLAPLGKWFVQLWAESLGKDGKGQTPLAAIGPTDQHSQLQLFQDGPADKLITFISVRNHPALTTPPVTIPGIEYFGKQQFGSMLHEAQQATAAALMMHGKPSGTIIIERVDAHALGQLMYFFERATAYSGELYKLNAFDQPGVEASKNFLHAALGNRSLAPLKRELKELLKKSRHHIV